MVEFFLTEVLYFYVVKFANHLSLLGLELSLERVYMLEYFKCNYLLI